MPSPPILPNSTAPTKPATPVGPTSTPPKPIAQAVPLNKVQGKLSNPTIMIHNPLNNSFF